MDSSVLGSSPKIFVALDKKKNDLSVLSAVSIKEAENIFKYRLSLNEIDKIDKIVYAVKFAIYSREKRLLAFCHGFNKKSVLKIAQRHIFLDIPAYVEVCN